MILDGLDGNNWGLKAYEERNGYRALRKVFDDKLTPDAVIAEVKEVRATGRRRGFPTGLKWSFMPAASVPSIWCATRTKVSLARSRTGTSCATTRIS